VSRITDTLAACRAEGRAALIPFLTAGDPDMGTTRRLLRAMVDAGADIIELGVPFSDPMADGPVLQRSSGRALAAGTTLVRVLELVAETRRDLGVPIVLFGYYNPLLRYGLEAIARDAQAAGVDGVLCVDLPPEEAGPLRHQLDAVGIDLISFLASTTPPPRVRMIARQAAGFLYFVSVLGVTGPRAELPADLPELVRRVHAVTDVPVAVGFGVQSAEQAGWVAGFADGVIVGSAIARLVEEHAGNDCVAPVAEFVGGLGRAVRDARRRT
jgi:tryptophan synthase alpha chain